MIKEFVKAWDARKGEIEAKFRTKRPDTYTEIVEAVVGILCSEPGDFHQPDPDRITCIDHGDCHGVLLFIIAAGGYQPSVFWYVKVGYGSCSGCDTLQAISQRGDITDQEVADYMTLALHILQGIKPMSGEAV